jgi:hypothetical protein
VPRRRGRALIRRGRTDRHARASKGGRQRVDGSFDLIGPGQPNGRGSFSSDRGGQNGLGISNILGHVCASPGVQLLGEKAAAIFGKCGRRCGCPPGRMWWSVMQQTHNRRCRSGRAHRKHRDRCNSRGRCNPRDRRIRRGLCNPVPAPPPEKPPDAGATVPAADTAKLTKPRAAASVMR